MQNEAFLTARFLAGGRGSFGPKKASRFLEVKYILLGILTNIYKSCSKSSSY
jgi:hypothetical protein